MTTNWSTYQAALRDVDALLHRAQQVGQQRDQQLQHAAQGLADVNSRIASNHQRIHDLARRLLTPTDPLLSTPPHVDPTNAVQAIAHANTEVLACDQALTQTENWGKQSPFLPAWSEQARSALVAAWFSPLPVLAISIVNFTGFWIGIVWTFWWVIAVIVTFLLASAAYRKLRTPPLPELQKVAGKSGITTVPVRYDIKDVALLACAAPSAILLFVKIFF